MPITICSTAIQLCPPEKEGKSSNLCPRLMLYLKDYCMERDNEGNFTCHGFHYGAVGTLYHFNPQDNQIDAYGRVCRSEMMDEPKTTKNTHADAKNANELYRMRPRPG